MSGPPYLLGLTGSIGMGKSTTAQMFADAGIPVWDADESVRILYGKGGGAVPAIGSLHPEAIAAGAVDRAVLKRWIVEDATALDRIEAAVHPLVAEDRAAFINRHADADILLFDIPLLFETGGNDAMDGVVVVTAPADIQRARVLGRGTMSAEEFETILAKQLPDSEKRARADYVIETLTLDDARRAVHHVIEDIRRKRRDA